MTSNKEDLELNGKLLSSSSPESEIVSKVVSVGQQDAEFVAKNIKSRLSLNTSNDENLKQDQQINGTCHQEMNGSCGDPLEKPVETSQNSESGEQFY